MLFDWKYDHLFAAATVESCTLVELLPPLNVEIAAHTAKMVVVSVTNFNHLSVG